MKILVALVTILSIHACTMFEKEERLLSEHKKTNGEIIKLYYVGLGATTKDVLQIRKSDNAKPLWVDDKYNCLNSSMLINDNTLQIVVSDTGYYNNNKMDTLIINVK